MIRRRVEPSILAFIDGIVALGIVAACLSPGHLLATLHRDTISIPDALYVALFMLAWRYCFSVLNLYDRLATMSSRIWTTFRGVFLMVLLICVDFLWFHPQLLTFRFLSLTFVSLFAYELARLFITGYVLDRLAARDPLRVLIVGSGKRAGKAWREIRTRHHASVELVGFVDDREKEDMVPEVATRFVGKIDEMNDLILNQLVDVILVAMPIRSCYNTMQRAVEVAEAIGVRVIYLRDIYTSSRRARSSSEILFTELVPEEEERLARSLSKRLIDVAVSAMLLVLLSPLFVIVALAVKFTSPGPVIFRQQRFGHRRRLFTLLKFRSMVENAEALLPDVEHLNEAVGPIFKMKNDPRLTKIGSFLRSTSLDELPQLWNVLKGDMSLVGPRPMSTRDVALFNDAVLLRRFSVKAGMTGLWQVSGRSGITFDDWITFDSQYIDQWSLLMDCRILLRTLGAVFRRSGAV